MCDSEKGTRHNGDERYGWRTVDLRASSRLVRKGQCQCDAVGCHLGSQFLVLRLRLRHVILSRPGVGMCQHGLAPVSTARVDRLVGDRFVNLPPRLVMRRVNLRMCVLRVSSCW
jgi:hypothetical protein